ncbi:hypothetical protein VIGAN_04173500 [Vigna angularis var. angularis]|uniref:Uncharacterized protein n=1 Tax=Vigna angularis var. angularis TaxID=157739 RepID=A0A0S3RVC6_PHAAN|nr:hypothetical protein VIGAN_04173500 [Vigna angularis var. angularis]
MYVLRFLSIFWCFSVASQVRVQAIRGLPFFYKDTLENIGKMVDILVQILGSEEFVEPDKALMSLLRQDVKGTVIYLYLVRKHICSLVTRKHHFLEQ